MLTALVIAVPEASSAVDGWRERTCEDRPSLGIPPHVTLLFPFVPSEQIDDRLFDELKGLFATVTPFVAAFNEARRWPGMLYLAPEPPEPFVRITDRIVARWPDYPPYEGIHEEVIPHLTVAYGDDALLAEVETDVTPKLPVESAVTEGLLLEEVEPNGGRWETRARFALGRCGGE